MRTIDCEDQGSTYQGFDASKARADGGGDRCEIAELYQECIRRNLLRLHHVDRFNDDAGLNTWRTRKMEALHEE